MKLEILIKKIKSVKALDIALPIDKGLYAITGQNGSGKSTVVTCAATVFFNIPMKDYFGLTDDDAFIAFRLENASRTWTKENGKWKKKYNGNMQIKGFYEGSIIFGNRFKNTDYTLLKSLDKISSTKLIEADEFIRKNMGYILHGDENFYEKFYKTDEKTVGSAFDFRGDLYYYTKGGKRVSQFHMSTGENLLVSILGSLFLRNSQRGSLKKPCVIFLDEIELALHPSSLKRLITFLRKMSDIYNYAIYFSTHSIELISSIEPSNIFFLERHADDKIEVLNPCYPAYATRFLYDHQGYDQIILVEDDLARMVIRSIIFEKRLRDNRLVHVLPCGGYTNVIDLGDEVVNSNLVGKVASIIIILDGDVEEKAKRYLSNKKVKNNIPLNFLPIESLEKFLRSDLVDNVDLKLFRHLSDYVFHQRSLTELISEYKREHDLTKDSNGKKLYSIIDKELRARNKTREEFVSIITKYLIEENGAKIQKITKFLKEQMKK